jgi:hypothetical protein
LLNTIGTVSRESPMLFFNATGFKYTSAHTKATLGV